MDLSNKKILVTGGAGFIGSHLVDTLLEKGADVFIIDNFVTGRKENLSQRARLYEVDINDRGVSAIFKKEKPELVFHCAFNTDVPRAVEDPMYDAQSLTGAVNIMKCAQLAGVKKFIFPSSGFLYGNDSPKPTPETQPVEAISPYAVSKHAGEEYLYFFRHAHGMPYAVLRYAAVYGPRQLVTGAMQDYIKKLAAGQQAEMYGDPSQKTRDYVFVSDAVRATLMMLDLADDYQNPVFNVGTGVETSLLDLYEQLAALLGKTAAPILKPEKPGEQLRYSLDSSKIKSALGWESSVALGEGLRQTLRSYNLIA